MENADVVLGAVRPGAAGPHHRGEDFPGTVAGAVIDADDEGGEPLASIVGAGDVFLISECEATSMATMSSTSESAVVAVSARFGSSAVSTPGWRSCRVRVQIHNPGVPD